MIERLLDPRFLVSLLVFAVFGWAFGVNPGDDTMKGAVIGALNIAVGYWLGSSRGAAAATENAGKALDIAAANQPATTPDIILKPGETAQAEGDKS